MNKRILSGIIVLAMLISTTCVAVPIPVSAASPTQDAGRQEVTNDISIEGTSSAGKMVSKVIQTKQNEQTKNDGNNIYTVDMKGKTASVSFETTQACCTLLVAVYDEAGTRMLASGKTEVKTEQTEAQLTIETEDMPKYFYLKAFLIDSKTLKPLCTAYESPNYTREMQEFFDLTTDDFKDDQVLNFDKDKTNNFAVYDKDTKVIEPEDGKNIVEQSNNQYTIKNATSEITSLKPGDLFAYEYEPGDTLIVKVKTIRVDGATAVITEADTSLEEAFDYVKLDTESSVEDAKIDDSDLDEGIRYKGLTKGGAGTKAIDIDLQKTKNMEYDLLKKKGSHGQITGKLFMNLDVEFELYINHKVKSVELKFTSSAGLDLDVSAKINKEISLANIRFDPVAGVSITITPKAIFDFSGKIQFNATLSYVCGASYSNTNGYKNLSGKPKLDTKLNIEGRVYVGMHLKPSLNIIDERLFSVTFKGDAGFDTKASGGSKLSNDTRKHDCKVCIAGTIHFKSKLNFGVQFFKTDLVNTDFLQYEKKLTDFYYSVSHNQFGFTTCPYISYKVTVTVKGSDGKILSGAEVNGKQNATNSKGIVTLWLKNGTHSITVKKSGYEDAKKSVVIKEKATNVSMALMKSGGNTEPEKPGTGKVKSISLGAIHSAAVTEDGNLYTWGCNGGGELGDGTKKNRNKPVKVMVNVQSVSLGAICSAAITEDKCLYTWGHNANRQLGDNTKEERRKPAKIMSNMKSVSLGGEHSAAVTEDGLLYTWGNNSYGQLGDGTQYEARRKPVKIMDHIKSVSLGGEHSAAITEDGCLYTWGHNNSGQLGDGTEEDKLRPTKIMDHIKSVSLGEEHSAAITEDGCLYTWGYNNSGQLGDGTEKDRLRPTKIMDHIKSVSLGEEHSAAITEDGCLYVWGGNAYGQLGDGTYKDRKKPIKIMNNVELVSLGQFHSAAITKKGILYTWGVNFWDQLGIGADIIDGVNTPTKVTFPSTLKSRTANMQSRECRKASVIVSGDTKTSVTTKHQTQTCRALEPNTAYNFYAMKDRTADDALAASNLLYIGQFTADNSGKASITYGAREDCSEADVFYVRKEAVKQEQEISAANRTAACNSKPFNLRASAKGKLTYTSSEPKIAAVSSSGNVTPKAPGQAVITITAAATDTYEEAETTVTITITPKTVAGLKVKCAKKKLTATWKRDAKASGYQVLIAQNSKFTKGKKAQLIKTNKTTKAAFKKLKAKKTYYVKARAYKTADGKKLYGSYSAVKRVKVK